MTATEQTPDHTRTMVWGVRRSRLRSSALGHRGPSKYHSSSRWVSRWWNRGYQRSRGAKGL